MMWGAPVVSVVVTVGFFAFLVLTFVVGIDSHGDPANAQIINLAVGALLSAFSTVVSYWLGSSQGSRDKDAIIAARSSDPILVGPAPPVPDAVVGDNFDKCLKVVLSREGGFIDNPLDHGGPTNMGITQNTLADWRGKPVTVDDVRNLKPNEVVEIYRANYWIRTRCDVMPHGVDLMVFDAAVNCGVSASIKMLQGVLGVAEDGSVGPVTLKALTGFAVPNLINKLADRRREFYQSLASFATFGNGWLSRVAQVSATALAMVDK